MDNTDFELVWRKKMVRSLVSAALHEIRGDDMRARRITSPGRECCQLWAVRTSRRAVG